MTSRRPRIVSTARDRWTALVVLCVGFLMIILDATVTNVALPAIQKDLGFSQAGLAWVVNAYLIAFGGVLLLAGRFGDLVGRKRVFLGGVLAFTAASLLCGLAQSQEMLIASRFLQGLGGATASAVILGMVVTMFRDPAERTRAFSVYSLFASAGGSIGLLAGGLITQLVNWHWIFIVNVPIGLVTAALAWRLVEDDRGLGLDRGADVPGALLLVGALMTTVYAIVGTSRVGWTSPETLALGAVALVLFISFVVREATAREPLVPLGIFRTRTTGAASLVAAFMVAGLFGQFFMGALYLQRVLRFDTLQVGLAFLPLSVGISTLSLGVSARAILRFGAKATLVPGIAAIATALLILQRVPADGQYLRDVLPAMALFGVGAGLAFPSLTTIAMSSVAPHESGLASGLMNTATQVGGALGVATLATLSGGRTNDLLALGNTTAAALTGGYQLAFAVAAALAVASLAAAIGIVRLPSETPVALGNVEQAA
jgi:EmrB/QacA subfamily drug resistance transporter